MKKIINYHIASKVALWIGVIIILPSLIYMILNLAHADNFVVAWAFFMAIGVSFSFIGLFFSLMIKLSGKKNIFS